MVHWLPTAAGLQGAFGSSYGEPSVGMATLDAQPRDHKPSTAPHSSRAPRRQLLPHRKELLLPREPSQDAVHRSLGFSRSSVPIGGVGTQRGVPLPAQQHPLAAKSARHTMTRGPLLWGQSPRQFLPGAGRRASLPLGGGPTQGKQTQPSSKANEQQYYHQRPHPREQISVDQFMPDVVSTSWSASRAFSDQRHHTEVDVTRKEMHRAADTEPRVESMQDGGKTKQGEVTMPSISLPHLSSSYIKLLVSWNLQ